MRNIIAFLTLLFVLSSCNSQRPLASVEEAYGASNTMNIGQPIEDITQSLFSDKDATISEENIQRILDGSYSLPQKLRVGVVNLENNQYRNYYWNNEDYLSSREKYLETITDNLKSISNIESVSLVPQVLLPTSPTFTSIREAAVRMQVDVIVVYSISGGMYSKYNMFKGSTYKAFATTQVILIDTRTGLVPFTRVITKDATTKKSDEDFNADDTRKRVQETAVVETLDNVCNELASFLKK